MKQVHKCLMESKKKNPEDAVNLVPSLRRNSFFQSYSQVVSGWGGGGRFRHRSALLHKVSYTGTNFLPPAHVCLAKSTTGTCVCVCVCVWINFQLQLSPPRLMLLLLRSSHRMLCSASQLTLIPQRGFYSLLTHGWFVFSLP